MNAYALQDLREGMEHSFAVELTEDMLDGFARLCGDTNPRHADAGFARSKGHPDRVAHGMLVASLLSTLAGVHLPGRDALLHGVDARFHAPAYPGDTLTVTGVVSHVSPAAGQIELKARIVNQHGQTVCKATVKVGLHG